MEGKVLGIPLVLLLLVLAISAIILLPVGFMNAAIQNHVQQLEFRQIDTQAEVERLLITPSPVPTATPSATPVILRNVNKQPVVTPVSTQSR